MNPSFFWFAIVCTVVGIFFATVDPVLMLLGHEPVLVGWPKFIIGASLSVCALYITYRFYFFKNVRIQFLFSLMSLIISIMMYIQILHGDLDPSYIYRFSNLIRISYIITLGAAIHILTSHLRKENLFVILAIASILTCVTGLIIEIYNLYYLVIAIFGAEILLQFIWIFIFYKEIKSHDGEEILDRN